MTWRGLVGSFSWWVRSLFWRWKLPSSSIKMWVVWNVSPQTRMSLRTLFSKLITRRTHADKAPDLMNDWKCTKSQRGVESQIWKIKKLTHLTFKIHKPFISSKELITLKCVPLKFSSIFFIPLFLRVVTTVKWCNIEKSQFNAMLQ